MFSDISHLNGLLAGATVKESAAITTSTTSGQVVSVQNTEGVDLLVRRALVHLRAASTAACTLDVGIAASQASADNLLDGLSVYNIAEGLYDNLENAGTNGRACGLWKSGQFVTASVASGNANGLVADFYIDCLAPSGGG